MLYSYEPQGNIIKDSCNDRSPSSKKVDNIHENKKFFDFDNLEPISVSKDQDNDRDHFNKELRYEKEKLDFLYLKQNSPKSNFSARKLPINFDPLDKSIGSLFSNIIVNPFDIAIELERNSTKLSENTIEKNKSSPLIIKNDDQLEIEALKTIEKSSEQNYLNISKSANSYPLILKKSDNPASKHEKDISNIPIFEQTKFYIEPGTMLTGEFPILQINSSDNTVALNIINDAHAQKLYDNNFNKQRTSTEKDLPKLVMKNASENIGIKEKLVNKKSDCKELTSIGKPQSSKNSIKTNTDSNNNNKILLNHNNSLKDPRFSLLYKELKNNKQVSKLNLILDIDETVVNSITYIENFQMQTFKAYLEKNRDNFSDYYFHFLLNSKEVYCVIRPGIYDFLRNISRYYNIYVYSHGSTSYIEELIKKIDPQQEYIRRDKMFTNRGDLGIKLKKKELKYLYSEEEEIKKTIILDDLRIVWENSQHDRVIISKKFIPFKDFMDKSKIDNFYLSNDQRLLFEDIDLYEDSKVDKNESQFNDISTFLEDLAKKYNCYKFSLDEGDEKLDTKVLCQQAIGSILKNCRIKILTIRPERKKLFSEIASILGAHVETNLYADHITHIVVDKKEHVNEDLIREVKKFMNISGIIIVELKWLMESYFTLRRGSNKVYNYKFE